MNADDDECLQRWRPIEQLRHAQRPAAGRLANRPAKRIYQALRCSRPDQRRELRFQRPKKTSQELQDKTSEGR
jgi:hypothetical protein